MKRFLDNFFFLGILIHEVSHYIIISFMRSASVKDVRISRHDDSYVQYEIYNPKIYKTMIISLAPFYINTAISIFSIYMILSIGLFTNWINPLLFLIFYYISIVSATKALPSTRDLENIFKRIRNQIFTNRFPIIIILSPFYLIVTIPIYIISTIRMKSSNLYYLIGVSYALILLLISIIISTDLFNPIREIFDIYDLIVS